MNAVSKKLVPIIASLIVAVLFYACQPNLYRVTNNSYKKQAKAYGKIISQKTIKDTLDWATPPKWVGTTNFQFTKTKHDHYSSYGSKQLCPNITNLYEAQ
jgi:hypothetical protein